MREDIGRNTSWYYNLKTGQVEEEGQSKATDLLGPFPDPESAAKALDTVHEREKRKEAEDQAWSDGRTGEND
jgi:hypothetical protein